MAIQHIEHNGQSYAVAFSIRELFALCDKKNMTLEQLLSSFNGEFTADTYNNALELACVALNTGARRMGIDRCYTIDELDDMMSDDLSLFEKVISALGASLNKPSVFPTAGKKPKGKASR